MANDLSPNVVLDLILGTCNNNKSVDLRLYFDVCLSTSSFRLECDHRILKLTRILTDSQCNSRNNGVMWQCLSSL